MKVIILAGGFGSRLSEETVVKPKPMVEIGDKPILWHILKYYSSFGLNEFIVALGYKAEVIKRYFLEYYQMNDSVTINFRTGRVEPQTEGNENWKVHLIDTGLSTMTGGRIKRLEHLLQGERFMVTYGDGVGNIDINALLEFHIAQKKIATITAVHPPARFGELAFIGPLVSNFLEKPTNGDGWINGGFMVFEPEIFNVLKDDNSILERDCFEKLAEQGQLAAFCHPGFWKCMDTILDKRQLDTLWASETPPWAIWKNQKLWKEFLSV